MVFRIDYKHFLLHMIDHFSYDDLTTMQWVIISSKIANTSRTDKVVKDSELYPDIASVDEYAATGSKKILKKMYYDMIDNDKDNPYRYSNHYHNAIYGDIINPLLKNYNVTIICREEENDYIDCLCSYLHDKFKIDVIDLNELFTKGHVGPIYIDKDEIADKAVDIKRAAAKQNYESKKKTEGGRQWLLEKMSKKDKIREIEKSGSKVGHNMDEKAINELLLMIWQEENGVY